MNKVIIGFGYIIPTGFYEVDHPDLMVFENNGTGISFVTFTHKHIMIDDFNGKSIAIDDLITPIMEEIRMIGVFCGTEELPSLQVFTTNDSEINNIPKPTNEKPNYYDDPTFDYPMEEIIPNIIQQQNDEYEESLKEDQMKELEKEIDQTMFNNIREETKLPKMSEDPELTDITSCFTMNDNNVNDVNDVNSQFNRMADNIINKMVLMINNNPYRIVEVEFYYQEDSNCDKKNFGTWNFNKNNMSIVFGTNNFNGSILIRSIQCLETEELISGPSDCVDRILSLISDINNLDDFNCDDFNCPIHLIKSDILDDQIHRSIRVGLPFIGQLKTLTKPYRFMIRTEPIEIEIGRPNLIVQMTTDGESLMRIVDITGSEKSDVIKYIKAYERGKKLENINIFENGVLSDEDLCELCGYASNQ